MLSDGTYTVNAGGISRIRSSDGFIIGTVGNEEIWHAEPSWGAMGGYIGRKLPEFARAGTYLGVWRDDGKVYLDVSELHRIPQGEAESIGRERGQKAIWDVRNACAIYL